MRTIAVLNQKGGVGKTTTVVNTAAALAAFGAKVIAIDFDPQAHLTIHLGVEPQSIDSGSYKVLTQSARLESEIMMVRDNLWLLPANIDLVGAESELVSVVGREIILREAIEQCQQDFDYCLIDCAPSLGLLTLNALAAAQEVLIPLQPHFLALQGFGKLLQTVEIVNRRINPNLRVNGILLCMFDSRASLPNEVKADIERFLNDARGTNSAWSDAHVLPVLVRRNIKLAEAPSYGKTIFEYESQCNGAQDYQKVAEFIHYKRLLSDEPEQPVDIEQNAEQLEALQAGLQPEDLEQVQEFEAQISDNQENLVETEIEVSQNNEEPEEYYTLSDENESSDNYQEPTQPENSGDVEEIVSENSDYQENPVEAENEVSQDNEEPEEYYTLSDESEPSENYNDQPLPSEEYPPTQHEYSDNMPEAVSEYKENSYEVESEVSQDSNEEPAEYYTPTDENVESSDYQVQHEEMSDQPEQPESQPEYQEQVQETSEVQNDTNKIEPEASQGYNSIKQPGFVIPKFEQIQNSFRNYRQQSEEQKQNQSESQTEYSEQVQDNVSEEINVQENQDQPEHIDNQSGYSNEIPKKPPFEIREIQTHSSPEPEQQYTQSSEESNQPEQTEDNQNSEHQGY